MYFRESASKKKNHRISLAPQASHELPADLLLLLRYKWPPDRRRYVNRSSMGSRAVLLRHVFLVTFLNIRTRRIRTTLTSATHQRETQDRADHVLCSRRSAVRFPLEDQTHCNSRPQTDDATNLCTDAALVCRRSIEGFDRTLGRAMGSRDR